MTVRYEWHGLFGNEELNALHAEAFGHPVLDDDWVSRVDRHSLGWACARDGDDLVGFVNLPWDGDKHAFVLDAVVAVRARRRGVGTRLISCVAEHARVAGCEWLHVDFEHDLEPFYIGACGFTPTPAGLIAL